MDLRALQRRWDAFARRDPLGAILDPMATSTGGDLDEFFASGEREIDAAGSGWISLRYTATKDQAG